MSKKIAPGKKPLLAALPVIIALVLVFGITIIFSAFSTNKTSPQISNPDGIFLEFGDYKITNEKLYYAMRTNYGLSEINQIIDEALLKDIVVNKNSERYIAISNKIIYGVEDLDDLAKTADKNKLLKDWVDTMIVSGYHTEAERDKFIELEYKREVKAREMYDAKIVERKNATDNTKKYAFDASKYQSYYENNYLTDITTIIILFDSQKQAELMLKDKGIDVKASTTTKGWISTTKDEDDKEQPFTQKEVQETFIELYNEIYQYYGGTLLTLNSNYEFVTETVDEKPVTTIKFTDLTDNINKHSKFVYTTNELSSKDSAIKNKLVSLSLDSFVKSYTVLPVAHSNGTNYFLALKINEVKPTTLVFNYDDKTDEEKIPTQEIIDEIETKLIKENFTADVITEMLFEFRNNHKLTFFDKVLETSYAKQHDNFYKDTLKKTEKDYTQFPKTKKTSKVDVLSFEINGTTTVLTADEFFTNMSKKYAANTAFNFMNGHIFLTNKEYNDVYNPETGQIFDKEKLRQLLETVKTYEYYFGMNYFEGEGFGKNIGWKTFIKEFFQVEDEKELAVNISILQEAKDKYAKTLYDYAALKVQMEKIFNEFYAASVINLIVYIDYDDNGSPDLTDLTDKEFDVEGNWSSNLKKLASELANKVYTLAPGTGKTTLAEQLTEIVTEYNEAVYNNNEGTWGYYKSHGLHLKFESASNYTNTSPLVDEFKDVVKELYLEIEEIGSLGESLLTPLKSDPFITTYGYHKIGVISTTDRTYLDKEENIKFPTEAQVELYLESLETDNDLTTEEKKEIEKLKTILTTYYDPAVKILTSDNQINKNLLQLRKSLVENGTFKFTNDDTKDLFIKITDIIAEKTDEAIEKESA